MVFWKKDKEDLTEGAYIKNNTIGSSNEISLSVLDAARESLLEAPDTSKKDSVAVAKENARKSESKKSDKAQGKKLGKIHLFTLPKKSKKPIATPEKEQGIILPSGTFVSSGQPTEDPGLAKLQVETAYASKREAKNKRIKIACAVAVVCAVLFCVGNYVILKNTETHQTYVSRLQKAVRSVATADNTIIEMDKILSNPIDASSFEEMKRVSANIDAANTALNDAEATTKAVTTEMVDFNGQQSAQNIIEAIGARREMLKSGEPLMNVACNSAQGISLINEAWDQAYSADKLALEAADAISQNKDDALSVTKDKTDAAVREFEGACKKLKEAQVLLSGVDISSQISYMEKRLEALLHAAASNKAMMDENTALAADENIAYTKAEEEAAQLAESLPSNNIQAVYSAYQEAADPLISAYQSARTHAANADAYLRNNLDR